MDTPGPLRGHHYPSHLQAGCAAFHRCPVCSMCQKFDKYSAMCVRCEGRKPVGMTCNCNSQKKETYRRAEELFRRPMFAAEGMEMPDLKQSFNIAEDSRYQEIGRQLEEEFGVPGIHSVERLDEPKFDESFYL